MRKKRFIRHVCKNTAGLLISVGRCINTPASWTRRNTMALSATELSKLRRIISLAERMIAASPKPKRGRQANGETKIAKRLRRSGKELVQFRKMLKAERRRGVSVADMARKHAISTAYIYTL